nr:uncharacterized protein LOC109766540 [Aegilops tauschii subsp. strangulata]
MKDFVVKPPCKRAPLAPGQEIDPTSIRRGEEFPKEWERRQAKLAKQAEKAVEEFNRASKASAEAGASGSASAPKKSMQKKPAHKPKLSMAKLTASNALVPKATKSSAPPPTIAASSASPSGKISTSMPKLKKKVTADEDELAELLGRKQEEAIAKNSSAPLLLDPKKLLDFIEIWCKKPDTPLDDLHLPLGPSHVLSTFILDEKHKIAQAKLKSNSCLKNMRANYHCDIKDKFITVTNKVVEDHSRREAAKFARATEEVAPEETTRATASVMPEENAPPSSSAIAPPTNSYLKIITLPSPSEAKKTKVAEKEAKKRKVLAPPTSTKSVKTAPLSSVIPIDAIPISSSPPTRTIEDHQIVPFGVKYVIPQADDNEENDTHFAATREQMGEEIEVEADASLHHVSSRKPSKLH